MTTKTEGVYRLHMVLITTDHQFTIVLTWVNYYTAFCMLPFATDAFLANRRTWNMFLKILWSSLLTKPFWYYQGKTEYLRNYELPNPRTYVSSKGYSFTKGQTGEFLANEWYRVWYIEQYKVMHDSVPCLQRYCPQRSYHWSRRLRLLRVVMQWRSDHACVHSDGHIQNLCNIS